MTKYTFGNTITAAERLKRIAEFFDPLAQEFIEKNLSIKVDSALDLGCGPGYSTNMLSAASLAKKTLGVDQSEFFIREAQKHFPDLEFRLDDVTRMKSGEKFNLIYCRFLLSHLVDLKKVLSAWQKNLLPQGILILDEFEDIVTEVPVFKDYIQISSALVASQGAQLHIGKVLTEVVKDLNVVINQTDLIPVEDWRAAGWFYGNTIGPWKDDKFIRSNFERSKLQKISDELLHIHNEQTNTSNITWKMKRIILSN